MAIDVGQEAPDFTLVNESNEPVTLSEQRGAPVVLLFYAFDFSGICEAENCDVRDNYGGWMDRGAKVFGISRDSRFSHAAFKEQQGFKHQLLADVKGDVARAYGAWNADVGAAERMTVVVDAEGKVAYVQHNAIPDARDFSEVAAALG